MKRLKLGVNKWAVMITSKVDCHRFFAYGDGFPAKSRDVALFDTRKKAREYIVEYKRQCALSGYIEARPVKVLVSMEEVETP